MILKPANLQMFRNIGSQKCEDTHYIAVDTEASTLMCARMPTHLQLGGPKVLDLERVEK